MPILDDRSLEFLSHSPEQTRRLGGRLGEMLAQDDVVSLRGDLGSGKTTFAQGIGRGWGALEAVTSPTFVLVNEYRRADGSVLYHVDAYRLSGVDEARGIGLDELLTSGHPVILEWPERIEPILPASRLAIDLAWVDELRRSMRFEALGSRYEDLLRGYRKVAFGG